ncbi:hypothetical protein PRZ48_012132 [Zasmidium cellare]|uniref:laccase n=1 Tax=Zasmidium cellare TaxID=395010 RepID=A0ABR0E4X4_ZASCE|nr:hypothetical protein PRZ48_012132 [Zasmidium cellare]
MKATFSLPVLGFALSLCSQAFALPQSSDLATRDTADGACTNGPLTRACWSDGFSIATDFDQKFPTTGNTVTYNLEITNGTCNPDGHGERICFLINGQYPGPTIRASWGDFLSINVTNSMQDNGTSIHWHGVRQYNTPGADGVNGLSECPLAPGQSRMYEYNVTQFGTSWYHAHYSSQYGDGTVGTMIFDGPATANYDEDLGVYPINEWYYQTAFQINAIASINLQNKDPVPPADNLLINGTNQDANGNGNYSQVTVESGKKYRLRLINMSVDNYIQVSLDSHPFEVITADFVPIQPFAAEWLVMGIGQRYDVIITANQSAGNYWFRSNVSEACQSANNFYGRAIWSYSSEPVDTPYSTEFTEPTTCTEPGPLTPYWSQSVPSDDFQSSLQNMNVNLTQAVVVPNGNAIVVWSLNSSINVDWENPTMSYLLNGNTSYPQSINLVPTVSSGSWNYWLIQQADGIPPIPHPVHLHGHDFFVLGQGTGTYNANNASLNFDNPTRRDTATIYAGGWLALAFNSNNPGSWLMHCHIAWHISEGLGMQFLESPDSMVMPDKTTYDNECSAWSSYYQDAYYQKTDSGI